MHRVATLARQPEPARPDVRDLDTTFRVAPDGMQ